MDSFILDSGAFTAFTRDVEIDLTAYIEFCRQHIDDVDYVVALDVIPKGIRTSQVFDDVCRQNWNNWKQMCNRLPREKIIPVFHRGESWEWLRRYIDAGCEYIGFGQMRQKPGKAIHDQDMLMWFADMKRHLIPEGTDTPIVKTHGFAATGLDVMQLFPWHSVDSSTWVKSAGYGRVWIPKERRGKWDYLDPCVVNFSPKSPTKYKKGDHVCNVTFTRRNQIVRYLNEIGMRVGEFERVEVPDDYEKPEVVEQWVDTSKSGAVYREKSPGLSTRLLHRKISNAKFIRRFQDTHPSIQKIYFAGIEDAEPEILDLVDHGLMSFFYIHSSPTIRKMFDGIIERLKDARKS